MKIICLLLILLSPTLQASCKCSCNPLDLSLCAPSYDLDRPCGSVCPGLSNITTPFITTCPLVEITNPVLGNKILVNTCSQ